MDALSFAMFISIASTALVAVVANRRQARHFMGAVLERHSACTWERPCMRDFWEAIAYDFTEITVDVNFKMTRSTIDELCNVVRSLH